MNPDAVLPITSILLFGAVILVPIFLRNRLLAKQLDVVSLAIQNGIEPERVQESLMLRREEGDINGNWKAAQILTGIGWTYMPFGIIAVLAGLSPSAQGGQGNFGAFGALLPGIVCLVVGARLHSIHRTVVGQVVTRGTAAAAPVAKATPAPDVQGGTAVG